MSIEIQGSWEQANQEYLTARLEQVRQALKRACGEDADEASPPLPRMPEDAPPPALDALGSLFHLSAFERDVLLLCAGVELDGAFAALCAQAQGDPQWTFATIRLALAALPGAYWSALSPLAPLRYWRLLEAEAGRPITSSPLRIDERILYYLLGVSYLDKRLADLLQPLAPIGTLAPSHQEIARELAATWALAAASAAELPVAQLCDADGATQFAIAAAAGVQIGHSVFRLPVVALPTHPDELGNLLILWQREAALSDSVLLLDCHDMDEQDALRQSAIARFIDENKAPLIIASRAPRVQSRRPRLTFDVAKPTVAEQLSIWQTTLNDQAAALDGQLRRLVSHFQLSESAICAVCANVQGRLAATPPDQPRTPQVVGDILWDACRAQTRPRLDDLTQHIAPVATWDDLIVPEAQRASLQEIAMQVRQRTQVYETWDFISKGSRGLGVSVLFTGPSGVGKTMAAEVLARELRLDLYRIDLSQVVSKYIGETEKNLRRIFDAAEEGGVILLFDEADALFGKRSEVKDSHDRYANIEVSYLLQRMEAYRGLAILTTNMKDALDSAFLRRIRFVVQFPFPDAAGRAAIWQRIFPAAAPTAGLDMAKLAQLNVAGGNIRNIALNAAFIAADAGEPIRMSHVLRAARQEYAKLEKSLTSAETRGWDETTGN
jgi:hypothetical protein